MSTRKTGEPSSGRRAAGLPREEKSLTAEAQALLRKVEAGGVPLYTSGANGVARGGLNSGSSHAASRKARLSRPRS